jgi:hypothetical protein
MKKIYGENPRIGKKFKFTIIYSILIAFSIIIPNFTLLVDAADTLVVDDDGTGDYLSIQDAIDNANVGDYIIVKDGTYGDQLTINVNSLTISAASGENPTIYVSSYSPGIDVTASDVLFEGFEIFGNGSLTGGPFPTIRASTGSDGLRVINNNFKVFTGEIGQAGLYVASGVKNITFFGNSFLNYAHQLYHAVQILGNPDIFGSIQDAIDEAIAGKTISVSAGLFIERLVIDKELTLSGNGEDTILQPSTVPSPGVYDVEIDANGTVIQNFQFDFNGASDTRSGNGIVVSDMSDPPVVDVSILNNIIYTGHTNTGIQTGKYSDISGLTISDNIFHADYDGLGEGVYVNPYPGDNVTINNNQFFGNLYSAVSIESSNVTVSNNLIDSNVSQGVYGIRFIELTGGQIFNGVEIIDNEIQNVTYGIRVGTATDVASSLTSQISYNTIINNDVGIWIRFGANLSNTDSINYNGIYNNTLFGINNEGNNLAIAIDNWWGDITGPYNLASNSAGLGDNVSDNVTFWPWLEFEGFSIPPIVEYIVGTPQANSGNIISDTTTIRIEADDNESGIDTLTYRLWNTTSRWGSWVNYTDDFTLSGDGKHKVEYNATDNAGTSEMQTYIHYVDTTAPEVNTLYPNGGEYISNGVTILWDANDKIPDQWQTKWNYSSPLSGDYPGHIQSFNPTETSMNSVQLLIEGDDANISVKIFSEISPVPITIAQSTQRLQLIGNPNAPVWIDFPLDQTLTLDTDETYYIGVTQEILGNTGFKWYYLNHSGGIDPYLYGEAYLKQTDVLELKPDWDWGFKTMLWEDLLGIDVEFSLTGVSPWSTIAEGQTNDGSYFWDTTTYPDGVFNRVRILAMDEIGNLGGDASDGTFTIDNDGPSITDVIITDTTISNNEFVKDGDNVEITATIVGDPITIEADLTNLGGGSAVAATSYTGTTAKWNLNTVTCSPKDGEISVTITAIDTTGDSGVNIGTITSDNTEPYLEITRPGPGLYIMDSMRLLPFSYPFIIGQMTVIAEATDGGSGIQNIEFYLENRLEANDTEAPYDWLWDEAATGFFKLEVTAYDNVGHTTTEEMRDIFIINLDIFG